MHAKLTAKVVFARISFFDSNPIGRILTRFTKDINGLDNIFYERAMTVLVVSVHNHTLTVRLLFRSYLASRSLLSLTLSI